MTKITLLYPEKYNTDITEWYIWSINFPEPGLPEKLIGTYSCLPYDERSELYNFDQGSVFDLKDFKFEDCLKQE
jgi:hypothetical protein